MRIVLRQAKAFAFDVCATGKRHGQWFSRPLPRMGSRCGCAVTSLRRGRERPSGLDAQSLRAPLEKHAKQSIRPKELVTGQGQPHSVWDKTPPSDIPGSKGRIAGSRSRLRPGPELCFHRGLTVSESLGTRSAAACAGIMDGRCAARRAATGSSTRRSNSIRLSKKVERKNG